MYVYLIIAVVAIVAMAAVVFKKHDQTLTIKDILEDEAKL